jgi:uncharacterized NAD(P)/FAD-binding protein YdhS
LTDLTVWVRELVARAQEEEVGWRSVIDAIRPHVRDVWGRLPLAERKRFLRHLRPYWDVHRHRLAPQVNALLNDVLARGQLIVHAARVVDLNPGAESPTVRFRRRGSRVVEIVRFHRVIDCTGPSTEYRGGVSPLMDDLLARGWARPDPLNLGLEVDDDGVLIGKDGTASGQLFALGPLTRGSFWESVAVPDIRSQCARLARRLDAVDAQ